VFLLKTLGVLILSVILNAVQKYQSYLLGTNEEDFGIWDLGNGRDCEKSINYLFKLVSSSTMRLVFLLMQ